ncbi:MAG: hypothetical protein U0446_11805 [Dehalococcoidia bacterium]
MNDRMWSLNPRPVEANDAGEGPGTDILSDRRDLLLGRAVDVLVFAFNPK